jgi:hypothetical protein
MDFIQYLKNRHLYTKESNKSIREISARQYNSRLKSMIDKGIYSGENNINDKIVKKIKETYVDASNEYERTIKYYLEYKDYLEKD